jgi:acetyl-CoA carboxylase biotin carboxyl carrier protein
MTGKREATPVNNSSKLPLPEHLNIAEIKELVELISEKQFNEFELQCGDFRLRVQKGGNSVGNDSMRQTAIDSNAAPENILPLRSAVGAGHTQAAAAPAPAREEETLHVVQSPIVGTFYRSPSPTSQPFVKPGDQVESGQTLCIIEAMKLMNEIHSDANGTISKIYVENGQPVEYGQPLFGLQV